MNQYKKSVTVLRRNNLYSLQRFQPKYFRRENEKAYLSYIKAIEIQSKQIKSKLG